MFHHVPNKSNNQTPLPKGVHLYVCETDESDNDRLLRWASWLSQELWKKEYIPSGDVCLVSFIKHAGTSTRSVSLYQETPSDALLNTLNDTLLTNRMIKATLACQSDDDTSDSFQLIANAKWTVITGRWKLHRLSRFYF
jgi:hypothetical protein